MNKTCSNCGERLSWDEANCPYCGATSTQAETRSIWPTLLGLVGVGIFIGIAYFAAFGGTSEAERLQQQRRHAEEANILWQSSQATKEKLITTESYLKQVGRTERGQLEQQIQRIRSAYRAELRKIIEEYEDTEEAQYAERSLQEVFAEPQE